jgi:NADPH2:quinone reductase
MARLLGARVIGVVSTPDKARFALAHGAHAVVDYKRQDLREELRAVIPDGSTLVIDPVGGSCSEPALRSLRRNGKFVVVGFASGEIPRVPLNLVLVKGVHIVGVDVRTLREQHPEVIASGNERIAELISRGWRPAIDSVFPLDRVTDALARVADAQVLGKVVVTLR